MSNTKADDTAECYLEYSELRGSMARLAQKTAVTLARFANMGVDTDSIKAAYALGKKKDPHAWLKALAATAAIVDIIPTETGSDGQVSFMPGLTVPPVTNKMKHAVAVASAYNEGYHAGLHGADETNNKYNPGTAERTQWSTGHIDGQAQKAMKDAHKRAKPNVTEAPTERRGRGRPRKAAVPPEAVEQAASEIAQAEQERAAAD